MSHTQNSFKKLWFVHGDQPARYAQVPSQALLDSRLGASHLRVLLALILHANRETGLCHVSRYTLSDYTGDSLGNISKATRALEEFGWLKKSQRRNNSNIYELTFPNFEGGALREVQNRRLPDDVWAASQAETLAAQEKFRVERREQHVTDLVAKYEDVIAGATSEFSRNSAQDSALEFDADEIDRHADSISDLVSNFGASDAVTDVSEGVTLTIPPVTRSRPKTAPMPKIKTAAEIDAALRLFIQTDVQDDSITDADLELHGREWGQDPDNDYQYTNSLSALSDEEL